MNYSGTTKGGTLPDDESIVAEAVKLVTGERNQAYGSAFESFSRTGRMAGAMLHLDRDLTPREVAMFFILHKMSRETNTAKRDNRVDMIGFTILLDQVSEAP